jgi:hypothetical protein
MPKFRVTMAEAVYYTVEVEAPDEEAAGEEAREVWAQADDPFRDFDGRSDGCVIDDCEMIEDDAPATPEPAAPDWIAQNVNSSTGAFDIELVGHGRIAHVDPWGAGDPDAMRRLVIASPKMLSALDLFSRAFGGDLEADEHMGGADTIAALADIWPHIKAAIAEAKGVS